MLRVTFHGDENLRQCFVLGEKAKCTFIGQPFYRTIHHHRHSEVVIRKYSSKQAFLKTSQYSLENTCAGVSFLYCK